MALTITITLTQLHLHVAPLTLLDLSLRNRTSQSKKKTRSSGTSTGTLEVGSAMSSHSVALVFGGLHTVQIGYLMLKTCGHGTVAQPKPNLIMSS